MMHHAPKGPPRTRGDTPVANSPITTPIMSAPHKWAVGTTFEWEFDSPMLTNSAYQPEPEAQRKTKKPATQTHHALRPVNPNPPKGYGGGVDTGDDGYGKANGPGPVPIDGVEGSARWPRQWPGGGRQWRRPAKTARRHAGSGTGGLGWHEFAGQPLGLSGGRVGRRRRAVRLVGEWRAIGPGRN